jgi:hypothetical protein
MEKRELNTIIALALVIGFFAGALGGGIASFVLYRVLRVQSVGWQAQPPVGWPVAPRLQPPVGWRSTDVAAPNSVEGQLRSQGKHWVRTAGDITVGAYVQDIFEGRMNQPPGRGAIGKVTALSTDANLPPPPAADVDFGRGYVIGVKLSELSLVQVSP